MAAFNFITPVDISIGASNAWTDIDVTLLVPPGSTGVIVELNNTAAIFQDASIRKKGSADDWSLREQSRDCHEVLFCGLDASLVFQGYVNDHNTQEFWLIGYTDGNVTFKTNFQDVSIGPLGAWTDVDVTAFLVGPAEGVLLYAVNLDAPKRHNISRKKGSGDNRITTDVHPNSFHGEIVGIDGDDIFQNYIEDGNQDLFMAGEFTPTCVTMLLNYIDETPGVGAGVYQDVDLTGDTSPTADGAFWQIEGDPGGRRAYALHPDGVGWDHYDDIDTKANVCWGCGIDPVTQIVEIKVEVLTITTWLAGYTFPAAGGGSSPGAITGAGAVVAAGAARLLL